jgi:hypothetical protein
MIKIYKYLKRICKMNAREFLDLLDAYQGVYELDEVTGRGRIDPLSDYPNHGERGSRSPRDAGLKMSPYDRASARANALKKREDPEAKKRANRIKSRFIEPTKRGLSRSITASNVARTAEKKRLMNPQESYDIDLYDIILEHLLDEGYADTEESATAIMANMSEDWKESICEEYKKLPLGKMMKKVQKRATREADTRAEIEYDPTFPTMKALKASEKASRENKKSDTMINVADTHSKEAAKARSKFRK